MNIIGNQLKSIMKLRGMSAEAVSQELISRGKPYIRNTISRKCNGKGGKTSTEMINEIADVLNIEPDVLTDEGVFAEYMETLKECEEKLESIELDDGMIRIMKMTADYLKGDDKHRKFEYICRLAQDERFFKEMEGETKRWDERLKGIDSLMERQYVYLGTCVYYFYEASANEYNSKFVFIFDKSIDDFFCLDGHKIPNFGPLWIKGKLCSKTALENSARAVLMSHDTGSELLNEKLREYVGRQGIPYRIKLIDTNSCFDEEEKKKQFEEYMNGEVSGDIEG